MLLFPGAFGFYLCVKLWLPVALCSWDLRVVGDSPNFGIYLCLCNSVVIPGVFGVVNFGFAFRVIVT